MSLAAHSMAFLFISRCKEIGMQLKELPAFETLQQNCVESGLQMLQLQGKTILQVVQGGMGVGVSAGGLAGAGLPLDLPELAKDFPNSALIPILADARGVQLVVRKWEKKGRLPSAIVIEHPKLAGGHLGAANIDDLNDTGV